MTTKCILTFTLRIILFAFFIGISSCYITEQYVIENSHPSPCKIVKLACNGTRGSASLTIFQNGKNHSVSIGNKICNKLSEGEVVVLYNNTIFNYYFMEGYLSLTMVIIAFCVFCFTYTFKYLEKLEKQLKQKY